VLLLGRMNKANWENKPDDLQKCLWCGKFVTGYDSYCDDKCWRMWIKNTDDNGNKLPKKDWL